MKNLRRILLALLAVASVASVVTLLAAMHYRAIGSAGRRLLQSCENDARLSREQEKRTAAILEEINNASLMARGRLFADIVAADPSVLDSQRTFTPYVGILDLDELHVSDGRGKLIRSVPESSLGFEMGSVPQSAVFMPALTNREFEILQPEVKKVTGFDKATVAYGGVARADRPGIIQFGYRRARWNEMNRAEDMTGNAKAALETRLAQLPAIAGDEPFLGLCLATAVLLVLLVFAGRLRGGSAPTAGAAPARSAGRVAVFARNPLTWATFLVFAVVIAAAWLTETQMALRRAEDGLRQNLADVDAAFGSALRTVQGFSAHAVARDLAGRTNRIDDAVLSGVRQDYGFDRVELLDRTGRTLAAAGTASGNTHITETGFGDGRIRFHFNRDRLKDELGFIFEGLSVGWQISGVGYCLCARNDTGEIESCGAAEFRPGDTLAGIGFDVSLMVEGRAFGARLYGGECLCMATERYGRRIILAVPLRQLFADRDTVTLELAAALLVVFLIVALFMHSVSRKLEGIRGWLAADAQARLKDERLSHLVQHSTIPCVFPDEADYRIRGWVSETTDVGGVFFDFYELPSGRIFLLVADVCGSGIPAAMFMMKAKAVIESCAKEFEKPAETAAAANRMLAENNDARMTVSAWLAVYDRADGRLAYVGAGLAPAELVKTDGTAVSVPGNDSAPLAESADGTFAGGELTIGRGERLRLTVTESEGGEMSAGLELERKRVEELKG